MLQKYNFYLPIAYSLQNGYSVWGQFNETFYSDSDIDPLINYSIATGSSLNEHTGWFIELFQSHDTGKDFKPADEPMLFNYGFTYLAENNLQFDISMGINFQFEHSDIVENSRFLEWGFSFRLPE